jgi:hypothetical protein
MGPRHLEARGHGTDSHDAASAQMFGAEDGELADGAAAEKDNDISE